MGEVGVMIFSIHTCYTATINGRKNDYEMYLGAMDDVIAVVCVIINV